MPLKYISIYKYKYIYRLDIKLQIVHTYRILATQTINMFYHMYLIILPKSQMHLHDYIIISQNK